MTFVHPAVTCDLWPAERKGEEKNIEKRETKKRSQMRKPIEVNSHFRDAQGPPGTSYTQVYATAGTDETGSPCGGGGLLEAQKANEKSKTTINQQNK